VWAGGFAKVLSASFDPVLQSNNGRIDNCGVQFKVAIQQGDRMFAVLGSLNEHYFKGKLPSISMKVLAKEFNKGSFSLSRLTNGFVRGNDYVTTDFPLNVLSDDTGAWLAMTDISKNPDLHYTFISSLMDRPWIGFKIIDESSDITFQLPEPQEASLFSDVSRCSLQALDQLQGELSK
jgi:hypothetical protein